MVNMADPALVVGAWEPVSCEAALLGRAGHSSTVVGSAIFFICGRTGCEPKPFWSASLWLLLRVSCLTAQKPTLVAKGVLFCLGVSWSASLVQELLLTIYLNSLCALCALCTASRKQFHSDITSFDTVTLRWARCARVPFKARAYHCARLVDGEIIVTGGGDSDYCHSDVWAYNPASDRWREVVVRSAALGGVCLAPAWQVLCANCLSAWLHGTLASSAHGSSCLTQTSWHTCHLLRTHTFKAQSALLSTPLTFLGTQSHVRRGSDFVLSCKARCLSPFPVVAGTARPPRCAPVGTRTTCSTAQRTVRWRTPPSRTRCWFSGATAGGTRCSATATTLSCSALTGGCWLGGRQTTPLHASPQAVLATCFGLALIEVLRLCWTLQKQHQVSV